MNYDDLVRRLREEAKLALEYGFHNDANKLCEYADAIQELQRDAGRLDWAESHPEQAMKNILIWWGTAGEGYREVMFNFRAVIDEAMEQSHV